MIVKESGLKIQKVIEGSGAKPKKGDVVMIHYTVNLGTGVSSSLYDYEKERYIDELVDSTYEGPFSGPFKIVVGTEPDIDRLYEEGTSIKGLNEALLDMKEGSKSRLLIPSDLAYGEEGGSSFKTFHGYRVPPNRCLDMVVEIVEIIKTEEEL